MSKHERPRFDSTVAMTPEQLAEEVDAAEARLAARAKASFEATACPPAARLDETVEASVQSTQSVPPVAPLESEPPWLTAPPSSRPGATQAGPIPDAPFGSPARRVVLPPSAGASRTMPMDAEQADALSQGVLDALAARYASDTPPWVDAEAPAAPPSAAPPSAAPLPRIFRAEPAPLELAPAESKTPKRRKKTRRAVHRALPPKRNVNELLYGKGE